MQSFATLTFSEQELRELYSALCARTSQIIAEEGTDSPKLEALREARAKVAEKLHSCPLACALAA